MEERYAVTQAASDGYRLDPETGEMIPIEDAEAEEIRDEATVQAEGAAMPNESLPPLPTQEAWQPAGQDWAEFGAWQEERERRFMEDYPPSPEMYGYAEPAVQTVAAAAPEKEQADTSEMRREPVVQGVRPEISEPAVMEPAARRAPAHVPASAQEPQSMQETERSADSTVRPADDGLEETVAEPAATATQTRAAGQPSQDGFAGSLFDAFDTQTAPEPMLNVQQEPVLTLYDLFGFSAEERSQVNRPKKRGPKPKGKRQAAGMPQVQHWPAQQGSATSSQKASKPVQEEERPMDWRERLMLNRPHQEERQPAEVSTAVTAEHFTGTSAENHPRTITENRPDPA